VRNSGKAKGRLKTGNSIDRLRVSNGI